LEEILINEVHEADLFLRCYESFNESRIIPYLTNATVLCSRQVLCTFRVALILQAQIL